MRNRLFLVALVLLVLGIGVSAYAAEESDIAYELVFITEGKPNVWQWIEVPWKYNVKLDLNSRIMIRYSGTFTLIDYFKFVNKETGEEIIWTAFDTLEPKDAVLPMTTWEQFDGTKWANRVDDNLGHIGGMSLYTRPGDWNLPDLTLYPKLSGTFDIIIGSRINDNNYSELLLAVVTD